MAGTSSKEGPNFSPTLQDEAMADAASEERVDVLFPQHDLAMIDVSLQDGLNVSPMVSGQAAANTSAEERLNVFAALPDQAMEMTDPEPVTAQFNTTSSNSRNVDVFGGHAENKATGSRFDGQDAVPISKKQSMAFKWHKGNRQIPVCKSQLEYIFKLCPTAYPDYVQNRLLHALERITRLSGRKDALLDKERIMQRLDRAQANKVAAPPKQKKSRSYGRVRTNKVTKPAQEKKSSQPSAKAKAQAERLVTVASSTKGHDASRVRASTSRNVGKKGDAMPTTGGRDNASGNKKSAKKRKGNTPWWMTRYLKTKAEKDRKRQEDDALAADVARLALTAPGASASAPAPLPVQPCGPRSSPDQDYDMTEHEF